MIGLDSYDNGTKNTWRGWQWNRIVERLPEFANRKGFDVRRMSNLDRRVCAGKTVLYLCGPDDRDRQHAIRLGFREENIIAIDVVKRNVDNIRKDKSIAVQTDLASAIAKWDREWPIDVVVADLCCGFSESTKQLAYAMCGTRAITGNTVVSINLQRGRDSQSNHHREMASKFDGKDLERLVSTSPHRGQQWWEWIDVHIGMIPYYMTNGFNEHISVSRAVLKGNIDGCDGLLPRCVFDNQEGLAIVAMHAAMKGDRLKHAMIADTSYRSAPSFRVRMDTRVFRWWGFRDAYGKASPDEEAWIDRDFKTFLGEQYVRIDKKANGRLAAMKAVRTMRGRGDF